jgi:CBS domain-containing protein
VDDLSSKYLDEILKLPVQTNMRMVPPTVTASEPISSVVDKMVRENIGAVVIMEENKAVGIITEKDVLERVVKTGKDFGTTLARDVMSKPLISIEADRPMKKALDLMRKNNIRRITVTKDGALIGLVTERRLLEVAFLIT